MPLCLSLPRAWLAALGCAVLVGAFAGQGRAETVRLKSGAAYEAHSLEVKGERLVLRLSLGAGTGTASFPFASIHAGDLARILAARLAADDAPGQLRIARLALEAGRYAEAVERAQRAAMLDPLLGAGSTEVLGAVRAAQAGAALVEIELDLRLGRPLAARERAWALLEAGVPVTAPELEAAKARLLLALAEAALAPQQAAEAPVEAPPEPLGPQGAPPPGIAAPPSAWTDALALQARALETRTQAADPALAAPQREALLSGAAVDLLDARRLLLALPTTAAPDLGARLESLRGLLVATWLDLADLARGAGQPEIALDRVQAALVLDPEHPRAWELRRWIEGDLSAAFLTGPLEPSVWFSPGYFSSGYFGSGFLSSGPGFGSCAPCAGPYASGFRLHLHGHSHGHSHGHGGGGGGGAQHNAGRRR